MHPHKGPINPLLAMNPNFRNHPRWGPASDLDLGVMSNTSCGSSSSLNDSTNPPLRGLILLNPTYMPIISWITCKHRRNLHRLHRIFNMEAISSIRVPLTSHPLPVSPLASILHSRPLARHSRTPPRPPFWHVAGWWLSQPLWKIWVRQLGWWNSPIYGKIKKCSKPPTR